MTPTIKQSDWFTHTSDKPYDRHIYTIKFDDGREYHYEDYDGVRLAWNMIQEKKCVVIVNDTRTTVLRSSGGQGF
tara:strand:- start:198 stop:422 length:225 start_codon:yes stop_codon:yes gene_type:complete